MALGHVSPGDPHAVSHNEERDQINFLTGEVGKPNRTSSRAFFSMHKALVSGNATIIAMGDSKTEGTGLETSTERWLYKLQESLRAQYGKTDKGRGYIPAKYGTFYDFTDKPTTDGTVTGVTQGRGLGTRSLTLGPGASVTFPVLPYTANTPLVVHWTRKSGGGTFEVVVGGVVRATIATSGGAASMQTEVTLPAGDHAVQLRYKGTGSVEVEGIFNRTAVEGIRVVDGSLSGGTFKHFGQDLLGNGHWSAAAYYGIDGVIMAFGANDMSGRTPAQMRVDARAAVTKALAAAPNAGIVILMGTERTQTPESGTVRTYEAAMRSEFAEDANVTLLYESDLWMPKAGVDYTWGGPSGWLVDTVHTSAHAHTEIARYIGESLKSVRVASHADTHAKGGSDPITPESIGAVPSSITLLSPTDNLNNFIETGYAYQPSSAGTLAANNFPEDGFTGIIQIIKSASNQVTQLAYTRQTASGGSAFNLSRVWFRAYYGSTWGGWIRLDPGAVTPASIDAYPATSSTYTSHADDLITPGFYRVSGGNLTEAKGYPPIIDVTGHLRVERSINSGYIMQTVLGNTADTVWYRTRVAHNWQPWTPMGPIIGKGSPEGRITAPLGFVYIDQDRTNGAREWVRPSGTANAKTGWQVTEGDTGWRDVSSLADPESFDFTTTVPGGSFLRWRRIGATVNLAVRVPLAEGTVGTALGFRRNGLINGSLPTLGSPANPYIAAGHGDIASVVMCSLTNSSTSTRLDVQPISATGYVSSTITNRVVGARIAYITDTAWPTSLPGTPA